jgi:hypothetical protein
MGSLKVEKMEWVRDESLPLNQFHVESIEYGPDLKAQG